MGLVGGVGEVLRFETEAAAVPVRYAPLTHLAAVQEVAGVKPEWGGVESAPEHERAGTA